jgi:alkylhydroperoxidase/carboxymuconolactone decarboxylase family protein YurZ
MSDSASTINEIKSYFAGHDAPVLFHRLAASDTLLQVIWQQVRDVMSEGEIDRATKELVGLSVAIAKSNEYMIGLQKPQIRRAGIDQDAELEAIAVAGFFEGFDAFAHSLHVDSDLRPRKLEVGDMSLIDQEIDVNVPYVVDSDDPDVRGVYEEIKRTMGIPFIPNIFKAMAHQPVMLKAKWESYKAIMLGGKLRRRTKELIAVAVSAVNACFY